MFINQLLKTKRVNLFLYLPIPVLFCSLMIMNYVVIKLMKLDVNAIIKQEIEKNGTTRFFIDSMLPFLVGLVFLFVWVKFVHKQTLTSLTTSRSKVDWRRIVFSFSIWSFFTLISTALVYYTNPSGFVLNFKLVPFIELAVLGIVLIPIQTSFEEYLFRGYMMQGIGLATGNKLAPLLITSFLFGIMHIANPEVDKMGYLILVYYIGTGLLLGIITLMDEGMELSLGFHASNNLIGALLITSDWSAFQTDSLLKDVSLPSAGYDILMPVFIIYPILLFTFSKKYKWTNWSLKLTGKVTNSI
jgi:membrane protease YdiL (CAAX protease family)